MVSHISQSVFKKPLEIIIITSVVRYEICDVDHKFDEFILVRFMSFLLSCHFLICLIDD